MNIRQLNECFAIVDFLAREGFQPSHRRGNDWWYYSPIRPQERTPSFKVNTVINRWYDHGTGEGGKLFDLALRLYQPMELSQVIRKLERLFSFHPQGFNIKQPASNVSAGQVNQPTEEGKIKVLTVGQLSSPALRLYLQQRGISISIAETYCQEVRYRLHDRIYYAIGFRNDKGGYELRNQYFKGSSSPKGTTFINNRSEDLVVLEGFFSFLSFLEVNKQKEAGPSSCLILNSLSFFEKSRPLMEAHHHIHLLLDNDISGKHWAAKALTWKNQYVDDSDFYQPHKDLNAWLVNQQQKNILQAGIIEKNIRQFTHIKRGPGRRRRG